MPWQDYWHGLSHCKIFDLAANGLSHINLEMSVSSGDLMGAALDRELTASPPLLNLPERSLPGILPGARLPIVRCSSARSSDPILGARDIQNIRASRPGMRVYLA